MATDIAQLLADNPPAATFRPYVWHSEEADAVTFYFKGDADYSKRLTDHVTLFLSQNDDSIVGCRIKGVKGIIEDLPNYLTINHGGVELSVLFLAFRGEISQDHVRNAFNELAREAQQNDITLEPVGV